MRTTAAIAIVLALAGVQSLRAQMTAEIDVERTVVPRLTLQAPLPSVVPSVIPSSDRPVQLSMSEYAGPAADFTSRPGSLLAPSYTGLRGRSPYRGYAWAGYFPAYKLGFGAGYRLVDTGRTALGASIQFDGSSYNAHLPEGVREGVRDNTVALQADFSHRVSDAFRLGALLRYSHAALAAPTMQTLRQSQGINDFGLTLSADGRHRRFGYTVKADICRFALSKAIQLGAGSADPASETVFGLSARIGGATADTVFSYSLSAAIDGRRRAGNSFDGTGFVPVSKTNTMLLSLLPSVGFRFGRTAIELGAEVDISSGMEGSSFHVAPVAGLVWTPGSRFAAFVRSKGGVCMTELRSIYNYSPFAPGLLSYDATFSPVDARAGLSIGPAAGFSAEIYARYASTRRAPMLAVLGTDTPVGLLAPSNISGWGCGLQLAWSHRFASLAGMVEIRTRGLDKGFADAPDRAAVVASLKAQLHASDRLDIELGWNLRCRRAYAIADRLAPMRNVSALNLGAAYALNDRISVFMRLENLLARRPEILPGLTSDGMRGMAGGTVLF